MPELSSFSEVIFDLSAAADDREVPKLLYSRKEAAWSLSISVRSLDLLVAAKQIDIRKLGKRIMIPIESLTRYASMITTHLPNTALNPS